MLPQIKRVTSSIEGMLKRRPADLTGISCSTSIGAAPIKAQQFMAAMLLAAGGTCQGKWSAHQAVPVKIPAKAL